VATGKESVAGPGGTGGQHDTEAKPATGEDMDKSTLVHT
jgi:hypothetical protein